MAVDRQRWKVVFSGNVQGVGFRYRTLGIARSHPVTGYVRNLPDGRVELVAEGAPDELKQFVAEVQETMRDYIHGVSTSQQEAEGSFATFEIRY